MVDWYAGECVFGFLKNNTASITDGIYEQFDKDGTDTDITPIY